MLRMFGLHLLLCCDWIVWSISPFNGRRHGARSTVSYTRNWYCICTWFTFWSVRIVTAACVLFEESTTNNMAFILPRSHIYMQYVMILVCV